jgi:multiple sugar transport system ATP-binding protein
MNLVEATVGETSVSFAGTTLPLAADAGLQAYRDRTVVLGIRPSDLEDTDVWQNDTLPTMEVRAEVTEELGSEVNVIFAVDAPPVLTEDTIAAASDDGDHDNIPLIADTQERCRFCARVDARTRSAPGATIRLSVDPSRFHFFDPHTGRAVGARAAEVPVVAGA